MNTMCQYCDAMKWQNEAPGMCCSGGKVKLPPLMLPPDPLESLASGNSPQSKHFLDNCRNYNCCFQMTSFGATTEVREAGYMPTFKVKGQVYHRPGSLLPLPHEEYKFLQIYFMGDEHREADRRCHNFPGTDQGIVFQLQQMLNVHNSYVKDFKTALEMMPTDDYKLVIRADKTPTRQHERRYNAPTVNEMAIVIVGNDFDRRDIILHKETPICNVYLKHIDHMMPCNIQFCFVTVKMDITSTSKSSIL